MLNLILSTNYLGYIFSKFSSVGLVIITLYFILKNKEFDFKKEFKINIYVKIFILLILWMIIGDYFFSNSIINSCIETLKFAVISILGYISLRIAAKNSEIEYRDKYFYGFLIFNLLLFFENYSNYIIINSIKNFFGFGIESAEPLNKVSAANLMIAPLIYKFTRNSFKFTLAIVVSLTYLNHPMDAAKLAFISSSLLFLLYYFFRAYIIKIYFLMISLLAPTLPFILKIIFEFEFFKNLKLKPSWSHRIEIWKETISFIQQKPFTGWGMNGSKFLSKTIPLHPHNMFLQIQLELGVIGIYLVMVLLFVIFRYILKSKNQAILLIMFNSYFCFAMVSFSVWQSWWLSSAWISIITYNYLEKTYRYNRLNDR